MLRDQVMLEHVEDKLFLPEEFEAVGLVLAFSPFEFLDEIDDLPIHQDSALLGGVGDHDEEVKDVLAALDDPVDEIGGEFLAPKIEPDGDLLGGIFGFAGVNFVLIEDQLLFEEGIELREFHLLGLLRDKELPVLHDLDDRPEDAEEAIALGFAGGLVVVKFNVHKSQLL